MAATGKGNSKILQDISQLSLYIVKRQFNKATDLVKSFKTKSHRIPLLHWRRKTNDPNPKYEDEDDENILSMSIKGKNIEVASALLHLCPELILLKRTSRRFKGQTALHLAVVIDNKRLVDMMLTVASQNSQAVRRLLNSRATGQIFHNTVMMGQLVLFVAVLQYNEEMIDMLLDRGGSLFARNSYGDTVFHSLIKNTYLNRDRIPDSRKMIQFLHQKIVKLNKTVLQSKETFEFTHIWYVRNNQSETALQLASRHGLVHLVEDILSLRDVYCFHNADDGLFDEKRFDITEIDSITNQKSYSKTRFDSNTIDTPHSADQDFETSGYAIPSEKPKKFGIRTHERVQIESVLEMMFDKGQAAVNVVDIIELKPIRSLIKLKWTTYRPFYKVWMIVHLLFMIFYSSYCVSFSEVTFGNNDIDSAREFVNVSRWFVLLFGFLYLIIGTASVLPRIWKPNPFRFWKHNLDQSLIIVVFALTLIIETIMNIAEFKDSGYLMVIAVNSGWWFCIFFLRGWKMLSFFTVLLKRIVFGDLMRFCFVIAFQLFAFTAAIHMQFVGVDVPALNEDEYDPENVPSYLSSLFILFNLMLGLGGIENLHVARFQFVGNTLYVVFVLVTYVLLLNALIAMMSRTCADLKLYSYSHWRIQQLSVILFMEDVLAVFINKIDPIDRHGKIITKQVPIYDPTTNTKLNCTRYFLDMQTLQDDRFGDEIEEEYVAMEKREKTVVSDKMTKEMLTFESVARSLLPFVKHQVKEPRPGSPTPTTVSSEDTLSTTSQIYPRFFEYTNLFNSDDDDDDVDRESTPEVDYKMHKKIGKGTLIFFENDEKT